MPEKTKLPNSVLKMPALTHLTVGNALLHGSSSMVFIYLKSISYTKYTCKKEENVQKYGSSHVEGVLETRCNASHCQSQLIRARGRLTPCMCKTPVHIYRPHTLSSRPPTRKRRSRRSARSLTLFTVSAFFATIHGNTSCIF